MTTNDIKAEIILSDVADEKLSYALDNPGEAVELTPEEAEAIGLDVEETDPLEDILAAATDE